MPSQNGVADHHHLSLPTSTSPQQLQTLILQAIPDLLMLMRKDGTYLQFISGGEINLYRQGKELELMNISKCLPSNLVEERLAFDPAGARNWRTPEPRVPHRNPGKPALRRGTHCARQRRGSTGHGA